VVSHIPFHTPIKSPIVTPTLHHIYHSYAVTISSRTNDPEAPPTTTRKVLCSSNAQPLVDRLNHSTVTMTTTLHPFAVDARGARCSEAALAGRLFAFVIDVFEVEGVDVAWDVAIDQGSC